MSKWKTYLDSTTHVIMLVLICHLLILKQSFYTPYEPSPPPPPPTSPAHPKSLMNLFKPRAYKWDSLVGAVYVNSGILEYYFGRLIGRGNEKQTKTA